MTEKTPADGSTERLGADSEQLRDAWQSIWDDYLSRSGHDLLNTIEAHRQERRRLFALLVGCTQAVGNSCRVLEIGSGTGIDSYLLVEQARADVFGFDLLPEAVALSKKLGRYFEGKVRFLVADATRMGISDSSMDVVFSQGVVEHFRDPTRIMAEQVRVVRRGGYVLIDVPQTFSFYTLYKKWRMRKNTWEYGWETQYSCKRLEELGAGFGLVPVARGGYGFEARKDGGLGYLRNLHNILRRGPLKKVKLLSSISDRYESVWRSIEDRLGHLFLINVVVVFQKP